MLTKKQENQGVGVRKGKMNIFENY